MTASTGPVTRVSSSLQTYTMLARLRQSSLRLFREQERLAGGQQLLSVSDDPIAAEKIGRLNKTLAGQNQILANLRHADGYLTAADSSLSDLSDLLTQAARIASEQAGNLQSAEERAAQVTVVDSLIDQLRNLGNRQYQGIYLFGGRRVDLPPFGTEYGRVSFAGDSGERTTLIDSQSSASYSISADQVFGLRSGYVGGYVDFDVQLSTDTRLSELDGANRSGVRLGRIRVEQTGPALTFEVDFTGAETVGDLIARFNEAASVAGSALTLGISPVDGGALRLSPAVGSVTVTDPNNGTTALDLGLRKSVTGVELEGDHVHRRMSLTTKLSELQPGGLSLSSGVKITHGGKSATIDFVGATTVQDILNRLNVSGVGIRAFIRADGRGVAVENLVAGTPLVIGENGGIDADRLGIKTVDATVSLSRLNGGRGIHPVESGDDFQITDANGISFTVKLATAKTLGDVISAINLAASQAGSSLLAGTNLSGGGLRLTGPAGPGQISVTALNLSPVAAELGLAKTGTATELEGDDVAPFYQPGLLTALYRLRDALANDDSASITLAGGEINALQKQVSQITGEVGARARAMRDRLAHTEDAVLATTLLLSELKDVDFTEAVTKFQQAQTALQASLLSASKLQNLSLLDFLG